MRKRCNIFTILFIKYMSIEFVIIPVVQEFEEYAIKIKDKLTSNITINIHFQIDTSFNLNVNSRINKWKMISL